MKHQWEGLAIVTEPGQLERGVAYAVRPGDGSMYYEPAVYLGQTWKRMPDGRRLWRAAWALADGEGWWRGLVAAGLVDRAADRWDAYLALPEERRPL